MSEPRVAIIGGGITGLAAAWELQQQGVPYTLFEASDRLGGKIVTEPVDGFTVEGGPDSFLSSKPWAWQLCDELGLRDRMIGTNDAQRNVYILKNGALHPYPKGMRLIVPVEADGLLASDLLSDDGKRRMLAEVDLPPYDAPADESLASFVRRHFGQEALDVFAEPLLAGIYVGDPEQMSIRATYPQYVEMERTHGSLIRAMRSALPVMPDPRAPTTAFFSLKGGTQELVDALARQLTGDVRLSASAQLEGRDGDDFVLKSDANRQELLTASSVIATLSAFFAYRLIEDATLRKFTWRERRTHGWGIGSLSIVVALGYKRKDIEHALDGFGFVVPKQENALMKACTWLSTKLTDRAPDNFVLIRVFLRTDDWMYWQRLGWRADLAIAIAHREIEPLLGIDSGCSPVLERMYLWRNPRYELGHLEKVDEIEALCPPGFYLAGSWYRGVGVPDCIHQGRLAAQKAIAHLHGQTQSNAQ